MPDDDKDFEDLASSAGQLDAPAPAEDTAISSDATPSDTGDGDLLNIVRDVVDKSKPAETPAPLAEGEETGAEADAPEEELSEDPSDEELAKYSSRTRRRIKQLLNERNTYKADATNYRNVQNFLDAQGLTAEETADGLVIMGLAKTNPVEAWQRIKPFVQNLLIAAGEVLPDDLKGLVQKGEISAQAAMEVSRSRAAVQSTQAQRQFEQQRAEQQRQGAAQAALMSEASAWQAERKVRDPNFDAKIEPLTKEIAYLQMREGKPTTPQGVRDQLERAYKALQPPAPRPIVQPKPAVTPIRGGQVAGNPATTARSTLDIIAARRQAN